VTRSLVTGATGFLGSRLVAHLQSLGDEVAVFHRPSPASAARLDELAADGVDVRLFSSLVEIADLVRDFVPDRVFHLATLYLRDHRPADIDALVAANISFGTHLLDAVVGTPAVVVSASTFFQYRNDEPTPFSLYSATKQAFSDIARFYREVRQVDVREVVLYDTFGPGDTRDKIIPRLVGAVTSGEHVAMGSSVQELNLLFVDDVARGFVAAAAPNAGSPLRLSAATTVTLGELVGTLQELVGGTLDVSFDDTKPVNDLVATAGSWPWPAGWKPVVPLAEALRRTLDA